MDAHGLPPPLLHDTAGRHRRAKSTLEERWLGGSPEWLDGLSAGMAGITRPKKPPGENFRKMNCWRWRKDIRVIIVAGRPPA